ncbi:DUF58 domain-containing protein [Nocardioides sp. zg-ZUI104]|uniref:DUF58 domain-containing protein n=1 Tax=Nocardioides faecalis TaxID=2803858 RepID=UPI001BCED144|nr:DUF58 domain-containing protein [Nocardioides faecalis]MBS4754146.1 DUF58 domain-containing protein [Nocardioides faecalis]
MSGAPGVAARGPLRVRAVGLRRRAGAWTFALRAWLSAATARPRAALAPLTDPVTAVVSPAAWALLVLLVPALVAGWALGWVELLLVGFALTALLLICLAFVLGAHRATAELDLSRQRVVVGERANGRLVLSNAGARRAPSALVELPVGRTVAGFDVPSLAPGAVHEELFAIPTRRRAILDLGPVRAVRADPFLLLRREHRLTEARLLHVHPRTVLIEGTAAGFLRDLEGLTVRKLADNDVSFHALREYVPGDDRRFVHWKSTARTGTLMVRQFEETRRSHLLVALSTRLDDYADDDELELAVSVAGSLGAQTLREGHTLSALTSVAHLRSDHATVLLDQLSGVDYDPAAPRLSATLRRLGRDVHGASVAVLLTGSLAEPADLRRARRQLAPDVRVIVVRSQVGADLALRPMGDLDLVTLGVLEELPTVMRRLAAP